MTVVGKQNRHVTPTNLERWEEGSEERQWSISNGHATPTMLLQRFPRSYHESDRHTQCCPPAEHHE